MNNINNNDKYAYWAAEYDLFYTLQHYNKSRPKDTETLNKAIEEYLAVCIRVQVELIGKTVDEARSWIFKKILEEGEWIRRNYDSEFNFLAKIRCYAEVCKRKYADGAHDPESLIEQVARFREECQKKHEARMSLEALTREFLAKKAAAAEKLANEQAARLTRAAAAEA